MTTLKWGKTSALLMTIITTITFAAALFAIPISGTFAVGEGLEYPYLDTLSQVPRDYIWMPLAIIMLIVYLIVMIKIHYSTDDSNKSLSMIGLAFAMFSTIILIGNYFVQFSVVPVSLLKEQTEGIALLTQYNPYGLFIVLEELGYILMCVSFFFMAYAFDKTIKLDKSIQRLFRVASILGILSFFAMSIWMGHNKRDAFEVVVIVITWLTLIINGILISKWFKNKINAK